jgi:hypothetical protein
MNTEELGFRSSLLTGDPQSRLGKTDTRGLYPACATEATSAGAVTQRLATGSAVSYSSHKKPLIGRSGQPLVFSACLRELFPWLAEAERKQADGQGRSAIVSASGSA